MVTIVGDFFDGKTSNKVQATLHINKAGTVSLFNDSDQCQIMSTISLKELDVSPRLGETPRYIYFPGAEKFETLDNASIDSALALYLPSWRRNFVHVLETHKSYIFLSFIILIIIVWLMVQFGIPALAKTIAVKLPHTTSTMIGEQALQLLDASVFSPTQLDADTIDHLQERFDKVFATFRDKYSCKLLFRSSKAIGANALALPSGVFVFTDDIVKLARNDDELVAILAHEIGHVVNRHVLRRIIQDSILAVLIIFITSDASSLSSIAIGVPTLLVELGYSRDFEREADQFALQYLIDNDINPSNFVNIMQRLEDQVKSKKGKSADQETDDNSTLPDFFSTHPLTEERLKAFTKARNIE